MHTIFIKVFSSKNSTYKPYLPEIDKKTKIKILLKLSMINKFRMAACAIISTAVIEGLIYADRWNASLGLNCTVFQITCAWAPKIIWYGRFLHSPPLNFQSLWWLIHSDNWCGFIAAPKATTALLQARSNHVCIFPKHSHSFLKRIDWNWIKELTFPKKKRNTQWLSTFFLSIFIYGKK